MQMCRAGQQSSDIGEIFGIIRSDFGQWAGPVFEDTPTQCAAFSPLTCLSAENKFNLCVVPVGQIRQRQPKCAVAVCRVAEFPSDSGDIEDLIRRPVDEIIASDKSAQRVLWWTPVTNVSRLADWQLRESNEMGMKANARQQLIGRRWRRHGNCWHWQSTRIEFQWTTQSDSRIFWQKNVKRMFHPMGGRPEKKWHSQHSRTSLIQKCWCGPARMKMSRFGADGRGPCSRPEDLGRIKSWRNSCLSLSPSAR